MSQDCIKQKRQQHNHKYHYTIMILSLFDQDERSYRIISHINDLTLHCKVQTQLFAT